MPAFGRRLLPEFPLDPSIVYLNHGTVGVPPRRVLAAQQAIRDEIELQPSRFLLRELTAVRVGVPDGRRPRLRAAADEVAPFLGARGDDLVFVDNATTGANAVLRSFPLAPGDEIVATDYGYGAVTNAARFAARERGATLRVLEMPFPVRDAGVIVEGIVNALGPRTKLAVIDHVTAETALVLPIAEISARCRARGVRVLADGAHAPGAIPLDIPSLGVDWYTGNLHKWMWTPRSSAILWTDPALQPQLHPTVISWGLDQGMTAEFDLVGTRDPSPHLAAPAAIALMREYGVEAVQRWNHALAWTAAHALAARWRTGFETPESLIGTMATITLPESLGSAMEDAARLRDALLFEDRIEAQVGARGGRLRLRISAQVYNDASDFERLGDAVARRAGLA